MKCKYYREQIILYLYSELNKTEEEHFLGHIETCSECKKELESNKKLFNIIDETEEDEYIPDWDKQWEKIEKGMEVKKPKILYMNPKWRWATAAAASFLLLFLGFLAGRFIFTPQQNDIYIRDMNRGKTKLLYVKNYFEDIKPVLLDYANYSYPTESNGGPVDKEIIESMLLETRLIKRHISNRNRPYLFSLIEDLEMILIEIRNISPGDKTSVRLLQDMIKAKSLPLKIDLFKNKTKQFERI